MGSFYGNSGISAAEAQNQIERSAEEVRNHIIISKTEPTVQKAGDIWFVIVETVDENNNDENNG